MNIVRFSVANKASILEQAITILRAGGTVVYPTETAYGLGADFYSPTAYKKIFQIKFRDRSKVLSVIVPDVDYASMLVKFPPAALRLAQYHWPGPLTLVLPFLYGDAYPHHQDPYLALRVSSHPVAMNLARGLSGPLIATSANVTGSGPCYSVSAIVGQLRNSTIVPDLIIDAGDLPVVLPSTIVKVDGDSVQILRQGAVSIIEKKHGKGR